jgi:hypothetical protein
MLPAIVRFGIAQTQFYLLIKFHLPDKLPEKFWAHFVRFRR